MATLTSRLKLLKPDRLELVNVLNHLNANLDRIDSGGNGAYVCTSTTRPNGNNFPLFDGQLIYETDTQQMYQRAGAAWRRTGGRTLRRLLARTGNTNVSNATESELTGGWTTLPGDDTFLMDYSGGRVTVPITGLYRIYLNMAWAVSGTAAGSRIINVIKNGDLADRLLRIAIVGQTGELWHNGTALVNLNAGDTISMSVYQSSGGVLALGSISGNQLAIEYVG